MKTWFLDEPKKMRLVESAPTVIAPNMIKVKVEQELLTMSDFEVYTGASKRNYPFVMGRSAVGVVSEVFDKQTSLFKKMDRVVIESYVPCETCPECRNGKYSNCEDMQELGYNADGLLQNFVDVPYTLLHRLPSALPTQKALFCSYVSFCLNIVDALKLEKGHHVAVFASTKTGLILAQIIAYYQSVPIFCSNKQELVAEAKRLGMLYCFNTEEVDVEKEIRIVTGGRMCRELVFFADSEFRMKDVYNSAANNATICLAGYSSKESKLSVAQICQKHLKILGVYNGAGNFPSAINLLVTNTVNVDNMIGEKVSFAKLDKELEKTKEEELVLKSKIIMVE